MQLYNKMEVKKHLEMTIWKEQFDKLFSMLNPLRDRYSYMSEDKRRKFEQLNDKIYQRFIETMEPLAKSEFETLSKSIENF
jgi:hypothetical protein